MRSDYSIVSVDYLIKSGALKNADAPIGGADWSVQPSIDNSGFSINLTGLTKSECDYFTTIKLNWATYISVNGYQNEPGTYCLSTGGNEISFIVE
jgi:hypothetical protein